MKITLTERFQKDVEGLNDVTKSQAFSILLKLPGALRDVHRHSGLGLRKIHPSGIFEARIGLGLRMVFGWEKETLILHRVGNHDEIQRYLKGL
jgi:mRNA-degrading endonuclease YafQ of YafQ-DinJ toxin-antitoxin module